MLRWRWLAALVVGVALVTAGCRGGDEPSVSDPAAEVLAHVPRDAALVVVGKTDFERGQGGAARELLGRFLGYELIVDQLKSLFERGGVEFDRDLAPLLGNDVVLAVPNTARVAGTGTHPPAIVATVVPDEAKLDRVVAAAVRRGALRKAGRYRGAELFTRNARTLAVKGPVVVASRDAPAIRAAFDLRARRRGLTPAALGSRLAGLPDDALVRMIGDVRPVLAHRARAAARARHPDLTRIPWVNALRRFAATVTATGDGARLRFRAETEGALQESQIPLATGSQPPAPVGDAPLVVGIRDPAHVIEFAQQAAEALVPGRFRAFSAAKTVIEGTRGIDLDEDLFAQLTGTATLRSTLRRVSVRAQVRDAKAMARTLDALLPLMPSFLHGLGIRGATVTKLPGGRYVVVRDGEPVATYALDRDALVVTTDRTEEIGGPGSTRPSPRVPRGPGALVSRLDPNALQDLVIRILRLPPAARLALAALGDATLTVRAERDRIEGQATLAIPR